MEVDEETRKELVNGLRISQEAYKEIFSVRIDSIKKAESVEEIMRLKSELLSSLISNMPLGTSQCYFCLLHDCKCSVCIYAEYHGVCNDEANSDYIAIKESKYKVRDSLLILGSNMQELVKNTGKYYKGEEYKQLAKEDV